MNYYKPPQQGWICPKCGRVNAPWLPTCGCVSSQTRATFDTTPLADRKSEPQTDCPKNCPSRDVCMKDTTDCPWAGKEGE